MEYKYWFANVKVITRGKKIRLIDRFKTAKAIYYIEETGLRSCGFLNDKEIQEFITCRKAADIKEDYKEFEKKKIRLITYEMDEYPSKLKDISTPPYALYVKGQLPDESKKSASIVGARDCTPYGETYALSFGKFFGENDIQVISGMARGVDSFGHRGALNGKGKTFAVLGCGVDICYPRENIGLYTDILDNGGGIISEFPPGTNPLANNFPARNRIISALSDIVLVMEAREKSGSLITADMALDQGKDVYALPGPINSDLSAGCNRLIYQGAGILLSRKQLIEELDIIATELTEKTVKIEKCLENEEKLLYSRLTLYPKDISALIEETGINADIAVRTMVSLQIKGIVREITRNHYVRI